MTSEVSLYEAKTHLSALVERAAAGEDVVITKNGTPRARLVGLPQSQEPRKPSEAMRILWIDDDGFDAEDADISTIFNESE
jgi:prevent-host-death family protein